MQHLLDLLDPQAQRGGGRGRQALLGLGAGQHLGQHDHVAPGPLAGVQPPAQLQQLRQRVDGVELLRVASDPLPHTVRARLGEQPVHAAEVVEDEGLVDAGLGGDHAGRGAGYALPAQCPQAASSSRTRVSGRSGSRLLTDRLHPLRNVAARGVGRGEGAPAAE